MNQTFLSIVCMMLGLATVSACSSDPITSDVHSPIANSTVEDTVRLKQPTLFKDTVLTILFESNPIEVIIKMPTDAPFIGTIVALPGWNFPNTGWCDSTILCETALKAGYAVILPEMGKSIYADTIFPETRKDWLKYPTRAWIKETMIPHIQTQFNLLLNDQNNFVMGLSTGARGAVLLALDLPETFKACAALSGDYDQTKYPKDNLYKGYYGPLTQFPDRWKNNDNVITAINSLTVPVYLGHGEKDKIVPIEHSKQLSAAITKAGKTKVVLRINPTAAHTYAFWNSEISAVLAFFASAGN